MPHKLRNTALSWLKVQPKKSQTAGAGPHASDAVPLLDLDEDINPPHTAPPSYHEAMKTTPPSDDNCAAPPSQLVQQFFHSVSVSGGEDEVNNNCLVLTKAAQPVVCFYYDLLDSFATYSLRPEIDMLVDICSGMTAQGAMNMGLEAAVENNMSRPTTRITRALIQLTANYIFMLAIIYASDQYQDKLKLGFRMVCDDDDNDNEKHGVNAIRTHVRAEIVREFVDALPSSIRKKQIWIRNRATGVRVPCHTFLAEALFEWIENYLDGLRTEPAFCIGRTYYQDSSVFATCLRKLQGGIPKGSGFMGIHGTLNTGQLDGPTIQECWRLFKSTLARTGGGGGMHDLLPPSGYQRLMLVGKLEQKCLRPLFHRKCDSSECSLSRGALGRFFLGGCL